MRVLQDPLNRQLAGITSAEWTNPSHKERLRAAVHHSYSVAQQRIIRRTRLIIVLLSLAILTGVGLASVAGVKAVHRWFIYYQAPKTQPDGTVTKEWRADEVTEIDGELVRTEVGKVVPSFTYEIETFTSDGGNTRVRATGPLGEDASESVLRFFGFDENGNTTMKMITGPEDPVRDKLLDGLLAEQQAPQPNFERVPDRGLEYIAAKPLAPDEWKDVRRRWIELRDSYKLGQPVEKGGLAKFERMLLEVRGTDKELDLYESFRIFLINRNLFDQMAKHYLKILRESPKHFLVGEKLWADHAVQSKVYGEEIAQRLKTILEAYADNPQAPAIHLILGKRTKETGDFNAARTHLQQVIRVFPENVDWLGTGLTRVAKGLLNEMENLNIGQLAPGFEATTLRGKQVSLAELRGKVVLLDFWATWCGPCVREIPMLKKLHDEVGGEDFVMISISADDDPNALAEFVKKHQIPWPQIREGSRDNGEISRKYNLEYWPLTYLIDRQGRIAAKDLGGEELKRRVLEAVSQ